MICILQSYSFSEFLCVHFTEECTKIQNFIWINNFTDLYVQFQKKQKIAMKGKGPIIYYFSKPYFHQD